jgi:hypothetical protein
VDEAGATWHDAPRISATVGDSPRRFVAWLLAGGAAALLAVAAFNLVVDPYGTAGTGIFPTAVARDASLKVDLFERLDRAPETVILGSSRSLKIDPRRIERDTGHTAFNAGVRAGGPAEAYALLRALHDRFPHAHPRVLWLLDLEDLGRTGVQPDMVSDPRLSTYMSRTQHVDAPSFDPWQLFSWTEASDSLAVVRSEINGRLANLRRHRARRGAGFRGDGYYTAHDYRWQPAFDAYVKIYQRGFSFRPMPRLYLERGLATANSWGVRPVLAIAPMHPQLLAAVRPLGWAARHDRLLAVLADLHRRYDFDVADMSSIAAFGGTPDAFYDPVHMRPANTDRLVDALAARYPNDI